VLVVEDDADLREVMRAGLADAGYDAVALASAEDALEECRRHDPDVILLDLALPRLSGEQFVQEYRRLPNASGKLIVVSGSAKGAEVAFRVRARIFLSKPFDMTRLTDLVRSTVDAADN
jgi:CheY-like chemotaxis protein